MMYNECKINNIQTLKIDATQNEIDNVQVIRIFLNKININTVVV